jgi:membrane-associated phospholipid phosphatase
VPARLADPPEIPMRSVVAGPAVAVVSLLAALAATRAAGVPLRDPGHGIAQRLGLMCAVVALLAVLDTVVPLGRRRERWTRRRAAAVGGAVAGFYGTYLAYRNLKSIVPLLRPGDLFDRQLAAFDRGLFVGHDPARLLHSLLGTGFAAQVLAVAYFAFFYFVPISLAVALVFSPTAQGGIFYAVALSIDWALGAASYYLLPALGPVYAASAAFAGLPATETSHLQAVLIRQRLDFLADPAIAGSHQGIAAFASLHTAILFTAALAAHMLGVGRRLRIGLWALFALTTVATVYLGWHYVVDDLAGMVIGAAALALARGLTGFPSRPDGSSGASRPCARASVSPAATARAKATTCTAARAGVAPSGSRNASRPMTIATVLVAPVMTAITGTAGPIWRPR